MRKRAVNGALRLTHALRAHCIALSGLGADVAVGASAPPAFAASPFAARVIAFAPAPGQFINSAAFDDPARALGPPVGGGTVAADNSSVVSLGGFGGSLILAFDHTVLDDPRNPDGLDFIVFSNAFWTNGDPTRRNAEPAVVEISLDVNGDGIANDPWFVIPGSSLPSPPTLALQAQDWDDDAATATPPVDLMWYPSPALYPGVGASFTTVGFALPNEFDAAVLDNPAGPGATVEAHFGYAELSPTMILGDLSGATGAIGDNSLSDPEDNPAIAPAAFYTVPDDPFAVGVDAGSGGGDAFDIAWAVNPATGAPANLAGFDFIRLSAAVAALRGPLGEASPEIDAVADVRPVTLVEDLDGDGAVGPADLLALLAAWGQRASVADIDEDGAVGPGDLLALLASWGRSL